MWQEQVTNYLLNELMNVAGTGNWSPDHWVDECGMNIEQVTDYLINELMNVT